MAKRSRQEKKSKSANKPKISVEMANDASRITKNVSKPSFDKQQRKEIQKAIEAGIAQYRREYSAKQRTQDKQAKKSSTTISESEAEKSQNTGQTGLLSYLPWGLLFLSWGIFAAYIFANGQ